MLKNFKITLINLIALILISGCISGCGSKKMIAYYSDINKYSLQKNYNHALNKIEKNEKKIYGEKNELLYLLDKGYFSHLAKNYTESNQTFARAKKLYDYHFTKSVTNQAASMAVNDKIQPYYGDAFEISMLYVFKALNYLKLDDPQSAAVEARAASHYLKTLTNNNWSKKVYKDDAFLHYIAGLIFEINKEYNNAFISYRKALYLYNTRYFDFTPPQDLYNSAINMGKKLGFNPEIKKLAKNFPKLAKNYKAPSANSELIILHYNGLVPHRVAVTLSVSFNKAWANVNTYKAETADEKDYETASKVANSILATDQIIVSVPQYQKTPYNIYGTEVTMGYEVATGAKSENLALQKSADIGNVTFENFKDLQGKIYAKAMARAAIKFAIVKAASDAVEEQVGGVGAFFINAGLRTTASLTEYADIRSWRVIPDEIKMARIPLKPGNYSLNINYKTTSGFIKTETIDVEVKANKKEFLILHTIE